MGYDGINIDYEGNDPTRTNGYNEVILLSLDLNPHFYVVLNILNLLFRSLWRPAMHSMNVFLGGWAIKPLHLYFLLPQSLYFF